MAQEELVRKRKTGREEADDEVNGPADFELGDEFSISDHEDDDAALDALRDESEGEKDHDDEESISDNEDPKAEEVAAEDNFPDGGAPRRYRIVKDANGGERYEWDEIDPVYDSDDSDAQGPENTIGNISLSYYDSYPHIGYDINGKKVYRPATAAALDTLLDSIEVPKGWTGLTNPDTGEALNLNDDELDLIRKIQTNQLPDGYDPYPDTVEYFTSIEEKMPLSAAPEPKRRFLPSKHEQKRIMKLVRAIREGRILPYKPPEESEEEDTVYDLWANEQPREQSVMHISAPKLLPPGFDLSYNPPPEYLPTEEEKKAWAEQDEEEREKDYMPTKYNSLRQVPAWDLFLKSRFERCLDLYLAPRVRKQRLNIDPMSLLPKLPQPEELKPFPTVCQTIYRGHEPGTAVRSVAIDPSGRLLASGGSDGTLRFWELLSGRCLHTAKLGDEPVSTVRWRPGKDAVIIAAAAGEEIFLVIPPLPMITPELEQASRALLDAGFGHHAQPNQTGKEPVSRWERPSASLQDDGVLLRITVRSPVAVIDWHRRGDHFCTVSPKGQRSAIAIHTLSKHITQVPFRRVPGLPQTAQFHPLKPILLVAMQRSIRCYDLQKLELVKVLQPGAKWLSSFDVHSGGSHVIAGSYDKRLLWHDLDLSAQPYKTMRFHSMAVRGVRFHRGDLPLFADASDDGSLQVFHGKVPSDSLENPTIVPLKVLKGHKTTRNLGVLDLDWHPREPWLVSAGADGTCRLWM